MKTSAICSLTDSSPVWESICHNLPQANPSWSLKAKKKIQVVKIVLFFFSLSLLPANYYSGGKCKSAEYMDHEAEHTPLTMVHLPARVAWESLEQAFQYYSTI